MDCVNIHATQSRSTLGKMMSNLANASVTVPDDGWFRSIEAYWYWLQTHDSNLRYMHGIEAKRWGQQSKREMEPQMSKSDPKFRQKICHAIKVKIANHPDLRKMFNENKLSFTHLGFYNGEEVNMAERCQWWLDFINDLNKSNNMQGDQMWDKYMYASNESAK